MDIYCYLKARFGNPNGFQTFLRGDHSDNWIHWDFNLRAGGEDVYICGMSREIHFMISAEMSDHNWRDLMLAVKRDFERVGQQKSIVLKSLEKWVIFPNKFVDIATVCAELHVDIKKNAGSFRAYKTPSGGENAAREAKQAGRVMGRLWKTHKASLELSLLTPVLAEAFINMTILILCMPEIRNNSRQFEDFIRSPIDVKLFDLAYKCRGFARPIDQHSEVFKEFKKVMDKRNRTIHGNCNPETEQLEIVYFEGTRPLFVEPGDHIGKLLEARESQYQPETVLRDYENTYAFLMEIANSLESSLAPDFRMVVETHYPGYDLNHKKVGRLFPDYVATVKMQGMRYDDEILLGGKL